jgi:hypothetical protein
MGSREIHKRHTVNQRNNQIMMMRRKKKKMKAVWMEVNLIVTMILI